MKRVWPSPCLVRFAIPAWRHLKQSISLSNHEGFCPMIKKFVRGLMILLAITNISFAGTVLELSDVFQSGSGGYHTYRIPVLIVSTNDTLLAFCEGRKSGTQDNGAVDLLLKRSVNGGKSWKGQRIIWSDKNDTCGNPAPVVDQTTGVIWLLMTWNLGSDREEEIIRGTSKDIRRVFLTHSIDDGKTWTKPVEITDAVKKKNWGWYATGPVNGIQLTRGAHKGRLVIPANHTEMNSQNQPMSRSHVIFSDDHGQTWQIGGIEDEKTNESTIVELSDGSLLQNMRSYHGQNRRAVAISRDGGLNWSPAKLDHALVEPICEASILRCTWPEDGGKN